MSSAILFHFDGISEETSIEQNNTSLWLQQVADKEGRIIEEINFIFCSDDYLLKINNKYLQHNYYTDIITFDNSDDEQHSLQGDVFISIDRVKENSITMGTSFEDEISRIMVHGLLHLIGYNDKTEEDKKTMSAKENAYLSLR